LKGLSNGKYEQALNDSDLVLELQPNSFSGNWNRALTLEKMGRTQEAIALYQQLLAWFENPAYMEASLHRKKKIDEIQNRLEILLQQ
jgi:tetratricopeptide (TPR) repeat protein